jgi:hypothetical protein
MKLIGASLALLFALLFVVLEFAGLIDPADSKLADDAWYGHAICVSLIAFFVSVAVSLLRRQRAPQYRDVEPDWETSVDYDPGDHDPSSDSHH